MTLTHYKRSTGKTWARIAAELSECAMSRDPDRMNRILEGRLYKLLASKKPHPWEIKALSDYLGEGATFD